MLGKLSLWNFVLFEEASFDFGPGLNVITGGTGAGKSLVAQALGQILGNRADAELIRADAEEARLQAVFSHLPDAPPRGGEARGELDVSTDSDGRLRIERILRRTGPGRLTMANRSVPAAAIRQLAARLVDFAAQNESIRLADPVYQRETLDHFGGTGELLSAYAAVYGKVAALRARIEAGEAEAERVQRRRERAADDLARLRAFRFDAQSDPALEERIRALSQAAAVGSLATSAASSLREDDMAVLGILSRLRREADQLASHLPILRQAAEALEEAGDKVSEALSFFTDAEDEVEGGAGSIDALIERAEALKSLARRLNCPPDGIPAREAELLAELETYASWGLDAETARLELEKLRPALVDGAMALRAARVRAGQKLAKAVNRQLADLSMNGTGFEARLHPLWTDGRDAESLWAAAAPSGLDDIVFMLAANPGEPAVRLAETASGGEMSRALLALKAALGGQGAAPTLFLDEVDSGVGGRMGDALGRKLSELAASRQIICISHLPQVAAWADSHLRIAKTQRRGRTVAQAKALDDGERREEIAQMIHGSAATETTRRQADEMLRAAKGSNDP